MKVTSWEHPEAVPDASSEWMEQVSILNKRYFFNVLTSETSWLLPPFLDSCTIKKSGGIERASLSLQSIPFLHLLATRYAQSLEREAGQRRRRRRRLRDCARRRKPRRRAPSARGVPWPPPLQWASEGRQRSLGGGGGGGALAGALANAAVAAALFPQPHVAAPPPPPPAAAAAAAALVAAEALSVAADAERSGRVALAANQV